ncbi:MAG: hypothetical protein KA371_17045 [Acidobacteria bacterium]|nr:hypothetical protein [Acidobacteriota bacterium]
MSALTILVIGIGVSALCGFGLYYTISEVGRLAREAERRGDGMPGVPRA